MKCIFCKKVSDNSKSVEHIIPESLGNKEHVLAPGVVCDKCNQYFALKIEKSLLEKKYFMEVRHRNSIESKKRRIPRSKGIMGGEVDILKMRDGRTEVVVENPEIFKGISEGKIKHMIVPIVQEPEPNDKILSRFLAKVAIESLAQRFFTHEGW
ncbi:MAG: HNH endonuclease, partial [Bacteroidota bacterium]